MATSGRRRAGAPAEGGQRSAETRAADVQWRSPGCGRGGAARCACPAAGHNFELAIGGARAAFGGSSGGALAGVVGRRVEVPARVGLVYVSLALRKRFTARPAGTQQREKDSHV